MISKGLLVLISILVLGFLLTPSVAQPAQAPARRVGVDSGQGVVCIITPQDTGCPTSPKIITTVATTGQLKVSVFAENVGATNGFAITLLADHNILQPANVNFNGTVLIPPFTPLVECIGGVLKSGNSCLPTDTADTIDLALSGGPGVVTNPPTTGLLFTAIYNIVGTTDLTPIRYQSGCGPLTSVPGLCVTFANGSTQPVPVSSETAFFSNLPSFTLDISPSSLTISQGSSAFSNVTLTSLNGFNGTVTTTSSGGPAGLTSSVSPSTLPIAAGATVAARFTASSTSITPIGVYNVTVTANSGSVTRTFIVTVRVSGPDFTVAVAPDIIMLNSGSRTVAVVTLISLGGFSGTVNLATAVTPSFGLGAVLNSSSVLLPTNSTRIVSLTLSAANTISGTFAVTVTGTSGSLSHQKAITVNVGDFSVLPSQNFLAIDKNISGRVTLQITSLNGFAGTVLLTATSTPSDLNMSLNPSTVQLFGVSGFSTLNVLATNSTSIGDHNVSLTACSGNLCHIAAITVLVRGPPPSEFAVSAQPTFLFLPIGTSRSSLVTVSGINGFSGTITLSTIIGPSTGLVCSLSRTSINLSISTTSGTSTLQCTPVGPGSYDVTVSGTNGTFVRSADVRVIVPPPDIALSVSPSSLSLFQGANGTMLVSVTSINGFTGSVNLSALVAPSLSNGVTASFGSGNSTVVSLGSGGTASRSLMILTTKTTPGGFYTITIQATTGTTPTNSLTASVQVSTQDQPPIASFTYFPANPIIGESVRFDASASVDPDGFIQSGTWSFGDGQVVGFFGIFAVHAYTSAGDFTVTLTVTDNAGLSASTSRVVHVRPQSLHDVTIIYVDASPQVVVSSQQVFVNANVGNEGSSNETVTVTAYYNGHVIDSEKIFIQGCNFIRYGYCFTGYVTIIWDTTGVTAGNYTISATVSLPTGEIDPTPSDNTATDGIVQVGPAPVLTVNPNTGPVGTRVLVRGSGFSQAQGYYSIGSVTVTFDDMFLGFTNTHDGMFNFTLDVPDAQAGTHQIKALDQTGAHASITFTVLPSPGRGQNSLSVTVDTGTLYFRGDTVDVYVLTSLNGSPVSSGLQANLVLVKPDGKNVTLTMKLVGQGLYKASYKLSDNAAFGTYLVFAKAHAAGPLDANTIRSFEVKPSWLSQNGPSIAGAATVASLAGIGALVWKKGYLRRKDGQEETFPAF